MSSLFILMCPHAANWRELVCRLAWSGKFRPVSIQNPSSNLSTKYPLVQPLETTNIHYWSLSVSTPSLSTQRYLTFILYANKNIISFTASSSGGKPGDAGKWKHGNTWIWVNSSISTSPNIQEHGNFAWNSLSTRSCEVLIMVYPRQWSSGLCQSLSLWT